MAKKLDLKSLNKIIHRYTNNETYNKCFKLHTINASRFFKTFILWWIKFVKKTIFQNDFNKIKSNKMKIKTKEQTSKPRIQKWKIKTKHNKPAVQFIQRKFWEKKIFKKACNSSCLWKWLYIIDLNLQFTKLASKNMKAAKKKSRNQF